MARISQGGIKTKQMNWHANMTELNHLGAALIAKPQKLERKMTQLFSAQRYSDNPLTAMLNSKAKIITSNEWEWDLKGASTRPMVVIEKIEPDTNTTPGKNRSFIKIKLDDQFYVTGDVIHPGNPKYQCRIQEAPYRHGNGWIYTIRLMEDDPAAFLPVEYLKTDNLWSKLYSQYEEAGEQSGSTQYSLPMTLKSRLSRYRKEYRVTDDAATEVLAVEIQDAKGKWHKSWIKYAEVEYWEQWHREKERGLWYSRYSDTVMGANGRPVRTGPGIQQLLEDSHTHKYTDLTARLIEEYLMDIFYSRVKPGAGREIVGYTGEYGMIQFHRAVQDWQDKRGFIQVVSDTFISKDKGNAIHKNALEVGYQYTSYLMANGAKLTLVHNPLYDDREINYDIDPITGYPKESQRITFLDFSKEAEGNIKMVKKKDGFRLGYVGGLITPFGPRTGNSMMSHSGNYYDMHVHDQCGVQIDDVSRCGELILDRN